MNQRHREKASNGLYACPCCGFASLTRQDNYEICMICFWEDDGQDDHDIDNTGGGPNGISILDARKNYLRYGACKEKAIPHVKPEMAQSLVRLREYKLINERVERIK